MVLQKCLIITVLFDVELLKGFGWKEMFSKIQQLLGRGTFPMQQSYICEESTRPEDEASVETRIKSHMLFCFVLHKEKLIH